MRSTLIPFNSENRSSLNMNVTNTLCSSLAALSNPPISTSCNPRLISLLTPQCVKVRKSGNSSTRIDLNRSKGTTFKRSPRTKLSPSIHRTIMRVAPHMWRTLLAFSPTGGATVPPLLSQRRKLNSPTNRKKRKGNVLYGGLEFGRRVKSFCSYCPHFWGGVTS